MFSHAAFTFGIPDKWKSRMRGKRLSRSSRPPRARSFTYSPGNSRRNNARKMMRVHIIGRHTCTCFYACAIRYRTVGAVVDVVVDLQMSSSIYKRRRRFTNVVVDL